MLRVFMFVIGVAKARSVQKLSGSNKCFTAFYFNGVNRTVTRLR